MSGKGGLYNPRPVDDVPVDGQLTHGVTSNRMFDHEADADAHHAEEIPDGRAIYGAVTMLSIPGFHSRLDITTVITLNRVYYAPMYVRTPITIDQVIIEVTAAAGAGEKCRIAVYNADINWQPTSLVVASAEIAIDANAVVTTDIADTILQEGRYMTAITLEGTATLRVMSGTAEYFGYLTTLGGNPATETGYVARAYAALPDPGEAWTNAVGASSAYCAVWVRVMTP